MRKLFIFLLITLSSHVFSQLPGSFKDFDQNVEATTGSLPFFTGTDPQPATVDYFMPSSLKFYVVDPAIPDLRFGIGIPNRFPDAKFEINGRPMTAVPGQGLFPALKLYGNIGLDVQGATRAIFIHNDDATSHGFGMYQTGNEFVMNYFQNKLGFGLVSPDKMLDIVGDFR